MRTVSEDWASLVATYRAGLGVEDFLAVVIPSRSLVLTARPWPEGWLPAGLLVYPFLAPMGHGIGAISIELADDRSSRLGSVACEVRVQAGQIGTPLNSVQQLLLTLSEQPAEVWTGLLGGVAHVHRQMLILFSGRITTPRLARGVLTFTIVDGSQHDHRDIEVPLGTSLFPGAPLEAHGLTIPLILGTALGVSPQLVASVATGTLATPLPAAVVATVDLTETGANFPDAGAIVVGSETITYSGRRVGLLLDGASALQLLSPVRSTPVEHLAGAAVTLAPPIVYRYLIGLGLTPLELLAVRDQEGVINTYTFVPAQAGLPAGTAVLELPTAHEGVQVDVQVVPVPPLPPLLNGGFETGALAPWNPLPGTTAVVPLQGVQAGFYKLQLQNVGPTLVGVTQDVAVTVGARYVLLFNWRTPVQMVGASAADDNLLENGEFTDEPNPPDPPEFPEPTAAAWEIISEGMEHAVPEYKPPPPPPTPPPEPPPEAPPVPPPSAVNEHGSQTFQLPVKPFYVTEAGAPHGFIVATTGYASYHLAMRQPLSLNPGQAVVMDVRVQAYLQTGGPGLVPADLTLHQPSGVTGSVLGVSTLPAHLPPLSEVTVEVRLWPGTALQGFLVYQRYLQPDQPSGRIGRLAEFRLSPGQGQFSPTQSLYQFEVSISGRYIGQIPPIQVTTAVVSVAA